MAATVQLSETNTSSATVTDNVGNSNMGSTDAAAIATPSSYPISTNTYSYEKWQRIKLVNLNGSLRIQNFKVWRTGSLSGSDTHLTNARTTGYTQATYPGGGPVNTQSSVATQTMPSSAPSTANLGANQVLDGYLDTNSTYTDYLVHQLHVDSATTSGATCTMNYQYDEVA